jgi:hypothetical protein
VSRPTPIALEENVNPEFAEGAPVSQEAGLFLSVSARYLRAANAGLLWVRMESEMLEGVCPNSSLVSIFAPVFHQESKSQKRSTKHRTA